MTLVRTARAETTTLTGIQKAAVLCMALGAEASARVLKHLSVDEVEQVSREIARTPRVRAEVVDAVLAEYQEVRLRGQVSAQGGLDYAREMLETALGAQRAKGVLDRVQEGMVESGLSKLRRATPSMLLGMLRGESPQTLALVLAHLEPKLASAVIQAMDPALAGETLYRVARMEAVPPDVLQQVEAALGEQSDLSLKQEGAAAGGPGAVARLLNQVPGPVDQQLLDAMGQRSQEIADTVRELMFVFEDLRFLTGKAMQRLLRDVETRELALAMKAASDDLKALIMKNMSERAGAGLLEEIEMLGAVKVRDVEAAHANIVKLARDLQAEGEIEIDRGGDDDIIA